MRELALVTISDQRGIEVAGRCRDGQGVRATTTDGEVLDLDEEDQLPTPCRILLEQHPHLRVIVIAPFRENRICIKTRSLLLTQTVFQRGYGEALRKGALIEEGLRLME